MKPGSNANTGGFWSGIREFFSKKDSTILLEPAQVASIPESQLANSGFIPFCKIGDVRLYLKIEGSSRSMAIYENGKPWELEEWGGGSDLKSRTIAEFYFLVTKDDFRIDESESQVILALINCIEPTADEVAQAKTMVYWTLIESTLEDGILTDEEQDSMYKIQQALELSQKELDVLHKKAIQERFEELVDRPADLPVTLKEIDSIIELGHILGLDPEFIEKSSAKARTKVM